MRTCTYCSSDVDAHDPVFVEELESEGRRTAGQFCNYACLSAWIDEESKTTGAACQFDPA